MHAQTYLEHCLKEGRLVRWPDHAMPLRVYIAPFHWYEKSKQVDAQHYRQMVLESLQAWSRLSEGNIQFQIVADMRDSHIDFKWRRVDRRSLGHCEYLVHTEGYLYSAEIQIGISDGRVHAQYNDPREVRHTILHEIGHALGLIGHSPGIEDIMYTPHQYGVCQLSARDGESLRALYRLPPGFDFIAAGCALEIKPPFSLETVLTTMGLLPASTLPTGNLGAAGPASSATPPFAVQQDGPASAARGNTTAAAPAPSASAADAKQQLHKEHEILSQMGRFHLATQHVRVPGEMRRAFILRPARQEPLA
jgi:hypothetical protein